MKYEKSCGAVVFKTEENELFFLIVQMNKGHWSFPKGHMHTNETEVQTALREIKEETNLNVSLIKGFQKNIRYHPAKDTEKEVIYFVAKTESNEIIRQESEIKSIIWLKFEKALERLTYDTDKAVLNSILGTIHSYLKNP